MRFGWIQPEELFSGPMKRAFVLTLSSLLVATAALATTYVRVEKDGTKTYSDRPIPGGQPIDIQPAQTYSAPAPSPTNTGVPREQQALMEAANFRYAGCAVTPRSDETFHSPESVTLAVLLTPNLRPGDRVSFSVDGAAVTGGDAPTSVILPEPFRGSHTVNVQVTDREGKSLCSASSTFHVQRPTLNSPARNPAPRPPPPRPTPRPGG
jgi:Domain of unknown function (DUF4124)